MRGVISWSMCHLSLGHLKKALLGLGQTSNSSRVEYIKNRCGKELTSFQRGSKRRTCVDPISQVRFIKTRE